MQKYAWTEGEAERGRWGRNMICCSKNKAMVLPGSLCLLLAVHSRPVMYSRPVVYSRRTVVAKKRERSLRGAMTKRKGLRK